MYMMAKKTAKFSITPTTAAVIPVNGEVNFMSPRVASTRGPPNKINRNEVKKVNRVAMLVPAAPASRKLSGPKISLVQTPSMPTNDTTIFSGPGVVSPRA